MSEPMGASVPNEDRNAEAEGKASGPWYKKRRWWAAGVVLVVAGALGSSEDSQTSVSGATASESTATEEPEPTEEPTTERTTEATTEATEEPKPTAVEALAELGLVANPVAVVDDIGEKLCLNTQKYGPSFVANRLRKEDGPGSRPDVIKIFYHFYCPEYLTDAKAALAGQPENLATANRRLSRSQP